MSTYGRTLPDCINLDLEISHQSKNIAKNWRILDTISLHRLVIHFYRLKLFDKCIKHSILLMESLNYQQYNHQVNNSEKLLELYEFIFSIFGVSRFNKS
ncbi:hypothetical protein HZS_2110 [Henneguya salminicola]|nr:hypothetical protein HZS_2110 [Henneguya salminicola]